MVETMGGVVTLHRLVRKGFPKDGAGTSYDEKELEK